MRGGGFGPFSVYGFVFLLVTVESYSHSTTTFHSLPQYLLWDSDNSIAHLVDDRFGRRHSKLATQECGQQRGRQQRQRAGPLQRIDVPIGARAEYL